MSQSINNLKVSETFSNVILTNITGAPDTDGVPSDPLPTRRTDNLTPRTQGRLQDGVGNQIPMVLSTNLIESEAEPASAYSVIRRTELIGMHAAQFINSVIWS
jgi:hypothetical protein